MTSRDASSRPTADECLSLLRGTVLPECFYSYAHAFLGSLRLLDAERQAARLCDSADELLAAMAPPLVSGGVADARIGSAGGGAEADSYLSRVEARWRNQASENASAAPAIPLAPLAAPASPPPSALVVAIAPFCACVRNVRSPSLLLRTLRTLLRLALCSDDAVKTQRVLPYLVACLTSQLPVVRRSLHFDSG